MRRNGIAQMAVAVPASLVRTRDEAQHFNARQVDSFRVLMISFEENYL